VHQCQAFLAEQIAMQQPRLILTLGVHVPAVIAPLSADLAGWAHCKSFQALDRHGPPMLPTVHFPAPVNVRATIAALTHPSLWHRCVRERRYGVLRGKEAELQMLREAKALARIEGPDDTPGCKVERSMSPVEKSGEMRLGRGRTRDRRPLCQGYQHPHR
jgi:uracil-DNA glycosylase